MAAIAEACERKVIVTGGTGAIGLPTVIEFAQHKLVLLVLIREVEKVIKNPDTGKNIRVSSDDRIINFQNTVETQTGIRPFVARGDLGGIDTSKKASTLVDRFNLIPGELVHYAPIAAEGINKYKLALTRDLRVIDNGPVTEEMLRKVTDILWSHYTTPERVGSAMQSNCIAHTLILDELIARGHIDHFSVVGMIASPFSADVSPKTARYIHPGPGFYWPIAYSKMRQTEEVRERAVEYGFKAIDLVVPEISDTAVGGFLEEFVSRVNAVFPNLPPISLPSSRTDIVAKVFVEQFIKTTQMTEIFTRQFLDGSGEVFDFRPITWPEQALRGYF